MRRPSAIAAALLLGLLAAPSGAQRGELPFLEVLQCTPLPRSPDLARALVRASAGDAPLALSSLRCGAYRPGTDRALFLNAVEESGEVAPFSTRTLHAVFPIDASFRECRCAFSGSIEVRPPPPFKEADARSMEEDPAAILVGRRPPAVAAAPSGDGLRTERILVPETLLRARASLDAPLVGSLGAGLAVEVHAVSAGWKRVRAGALEGWIPADASAPPDPASAPLDRAFSQLAELADADLCALPRERLDALVFSWQPASGRVAVRSAWFRRSAQERALFRRYAADCFGATEVTTIGGGRVLALPRSGEATP